MQKRKFEIITTILFILIVLFAGLNAVRFFLRLDITENKTFTISKVSKNLFQEIPEHVHIIYYRSEKLKKLSSVPSQVEDMLYEYAANSRGKITVDFIDPAEKGLEQAAQGAGVVPQQVQVVEKNERSVALIYSGIVIQYLDRKSVIPMVLRTETLEYELTTKIRSLVENKTRTVGVLVGDAARSFKQDYSMLAQTLQQKYGLQEIKLGDQIPSDLSVLLVLGNKDIQKEDLKPIDTYIMNGGSVFFCVESVYIDLKSNLQAFPIPDTAIKNLLKNYGVQLEDPLVLDTYCRDFRLPTRAFGGVAWQILGKYPHWIAVLDKNVSKSNPITARFTGLDLLWPDPLKVLESKDHTADILIKSSEKSWLMKKDFNTNPYQAQMFAYSKAGTVGQYDLGVVLQGKFQSYFSDKKSKDTRMIVVGDTDFASNILQYSDSSYNIAFMDNAVEWLSNDDDLINIKTRSVRDTRLNKIVDPDQKRRAYIFSIVINLVIIPIGVVLFGIRRFRSRKKRQYRNEEA